ncbi:hypothetical protein D3C81_1712950 [compost metagenome]
MSLLRLEPSVASQEAGDGGDIGQLHKLLTSPTYKGEYVFNRKVWKTKEEKPDAERVCMRSLVHHTRRGRPLHDSQAPTRQRTFGSRRA